MLAVLKWYLSHDYLKYMLYTKRMSRSLEYYISQVSSHRRVFGHGLMHRPPRINPGKVNQILLFPGSFNPSHRGHLELLRHALDNCGSGANLRHCHSFRR